MEKLSPEDRFSSLADQYASLTIIADQIPISDLSHQSQRTSTLRKYGVESFINTLRTTVAFEDANGNNSHIKSALYKECAETLQKDAELFSSPQANEYYKLAAVLYMYSAIESQGISAANAHAVFHCLAQIADLNEENRVDK